MKIKATITFHYHDENQAKIAYESLEPENVGFLKSYQDHDSLVSKLEGESLKTILSTADDLIFSEMLVEKVLELQNRQKDV
ncbi:MAG: hypothetical protein HVN35_03225 [Methanobacteriaceae archaeon]|nr:hypothetical protein [Methanobacteriaceae archaeon]